MAASAKLAIDKLDKLLYNAFMDNKYTHIRIWKATLKELRRIHAETGESMIVIVDRLANAEIDRVKADLRDKDTISEKA